LQEELVSVDDELQALEIQIQELLEHQQQLIQKKTVLKKKITQLSDTESGSSKETGSATEDWNKEDFPWSTKIRDVLQKSFGLQSFRPLQLETINATMAGRDVFLVMPTGGGKSLCYQLPAEGSPVMLNSLTYFVDTGIIYCFSQKDAEQVTMSLQKLGIKAGTYHANMEPKDKSRVHKRWCANEIQVVVATVAFGMGIDKPDVRFVIHHSMSKSMENYYQESGRAGRDDQRADCILYYGFGDIFRISTMVVMENVGQQKLYGMVSYCHDMG
ncbi:ATP-dependent DNA helicase Q1-like, partial [Protobothrops mucrosquamatus]|uniref:ATP-dependent DNA helicase Q1-like n=1 Tax=Protobothrops mucrosquamatus TaxID=103944 RepID=UPI000775A435